MLQFAGTQAALVLALSLFALQTSPTCCTHCSTGKKEWSFMWDLCQRHGYELISSRYDFTGFMPYLFALVSCLFLFGLVMSIFSWCGALSALESALTVSEFRASWDGQGHHGPASSRTIQTEQSMPLSLSAASSEQSPASLQFRVNI